MKFDQHTSFLLSVFTSSVHLQLPSGHCGTEHIPVVLLHTFQASVQCKCEQQVSKLNIILAVYFFLNVCCKSNISVLNGQLTAQREECKISFYHFLSRDAR